MKKSSFISTLIGSFYNPETYRDAVTQKKGGTFGYLALLVLLCTLPLMIGIIVGVGHFMKNDGKYILDQFPALTFSHGTVSMDKASPYSIKSKGGETLVVIDLSDSANITELPGNAKVQLTRNKIIAQQSATETRTYDLSSFQNLSLDAQKIRGWFAYAWIVYIIIFILMVICFYIYRVIQAVFNAVIGLIISALLKVNLDFSSLIYITIVAITPVAIIASILWVSEIHIPMKGWLGFILALGYIAFGILANKPGEENSLSPAAEAAPTEEGGTA